jgi:hypothetical protein
LKRKGSRKGVTDEISKKCLAAFRVLSNCMKRWLFLYIFPTQKNMGGNAGANAQKQ